MASVQLTALYVILRQVNRGIALLAAFFGLIYVFLLFVFGVGSLLRAPLGGRSGLINDIRTGSPGCPCQIPARLNPQKTSVSGILRRAFKAQLEEVLNYVDASP